MVDISICSGEHKVKGDCPKRDSCQRYLSYIDREKWSHWQAHIGTAFVKKLDGVSCDHYIKTNNNK